MDQSNPNFASPQQPQPPITNTSNQTSNNGMTSTNQPLQPQLTSIPNSTSNPTQNISQSSSSLPPPPPPPMFGAPTNLQPMAIDPLALQMMQQQMQQLQQNPLIQQQLHQTQQKLQEGIQLGLNPMNMDPEQLKQHQEQLLALNLNPQQLQMAKLAQMAVLNNIKNNQIGQQQIQQGSNDDNNTQKGQNNQNNNQAGSKLTPNTTTPSDTTNPTPQTTNQTPITTIPSLPTTIPTIPPTISTTIPPIPPIIPPMPGFPSSTTIPAIIPPIPSIVPGMFMQHSMPMVIPPPLPTNTVDLSAVNELKTQKEREERERQVQKQKEIHEREILLREKKLKETQEKIEKEKKEKELKVQQLKEMKLKQEAEKLAKLELLKAQKLKKSGGNVTNTASVESNTSNTTTNGTTTSSTDSTTNITPTMNDLPPTATSTTTNPSETTSTTASTTSSTTSTQTTMNNNATNTQLSSNLSETARERLFLELIQSKMMIQPQNIGSTSNQGQYGQYNTTMQQELNGNQNQSQLQFQSMTWVQLLPLIVTSPSFSLVEVPTRRKELFQLFVHSQGQYNITTHYSIEDKKRRDEELIANAQLSDAVFVAYDINHINDIVQKNIHFQFNNQDRIHSTPNVQQHTITLKATSGIKLNEQDVDIPNECFLNINHNQTNNTINTNHPNIPRFPYLIDTLYYNYYTTHCMPTTSSTVKSEPTTEITNIENNTPNPSQSSTTTPQSTSTITPCPFCRIMQTLQQQLRDKKLPSITNPQITTPSSTSTTITTVSTRPPTHITLTGTVLCPFHCHLNNLPSQHSTSSQNNNIQSPQHPIIPFLPTTLLLPKPPTIFTNLDIQLTYHKQSKLFLQSLLFQHLLHFMASLSGMCFTQHELSLFHLIGDRFPSISTLIDAQATTKANLPHLINPQQQFNQSQYPTGSNQGQGVMQPFNQQQLGSNFTNTTHFAHHNIKQISSTPQCRKYIVQTILGPKAIVVDCTTNLSDFGQSSIQQHKPSTSSLISAQDYQLLLSATSPTDLGRILAKNASQMAKVTQNEKMDENDANPSQTNSTKQYGIDFCDGNDVPVLNAISTLLRTQKTFLQISQTIEQYHLNQSKQHIQSNGIKQQDGNGINGDNDELIQNRKNILKIYEKDQSQCVIDSLNNNPDYYYSIISSTIFQQQNKIDRKCQTGQKTTKLSQSRCLCMGLCENQSFNTQFTTSVENAVNSTQQTQNATNSSTTPNSTLKFNFAPPLLMQLILTTSQLHNTPINSQQTCNNVITTLLSMPFMQHIISQLIPDFAVDVYYEKNLKLGGNDVQNGQNGQNNQNIGQNDSKNDTNPLSSGKQVLIKVLQYIIPFIQAKLDYYVQQMNAVRNSFESTITNENALRSFLMKCVHDGDNNNDTNNNKANDNNNEKAENESKLTNSMIDDYQDDNDTTISKSMNNIQSKVQLPFQAKVLQNFISLVLTQINQHTSTKAQQVVDILAPFDQSTLKINKINDENITKVIQYASNLHSNITQQHNNNNTNTSSIPSSIPIGSDSFFLHPHRLFQPLPFQSPIHNIDYQFPTSSQNTSSSTTNTPQLSSSTVLQSSNNNHITLPSSKYYKNLTFSQPPWLSSFLSQRTSSLYALTSLFTQNGQNGSKIINSTTTQEDYYINQITQHLITLPPFFPLSLLLFPPLITSSTQQIGHNNNTPQTNTNNSFLLQYLKFPHEQTYSTQSIQSTSSSTSTTATTVSKSNLVIEKDLFVQDIVENGPTGTYYCPCLQPFYTNNRHTSQYTHKPHSLCILQYLFSFQTFSFHEFFTHRLHALNLPSLYDTHTDMITHAGLINTMGNNNNTTDSSTITTKTSTTSTISPMYPIITTKQLDTSIQIIPPFILSTQSHPFIPSTIPNVFIDDAYAQESNHYFFPNALFTQNQQQQQQSQQTQQNQNRQQFDPNHLQQQSPSHKQQYTWYPRMSYIAQLLEHTLDVINALVKQQADLIKDIYEPLHKKAMQNRIVELNSISNNNNNDDNNNIEKLSKFNFLTLFQDIYNQMIDQRDLLLDPVINANPTLSAPTAAQFESISSNQQQSNPTTEQQTSDQPTTTTTTPTPIASFTPSVPPPLISTQFTKLLQSPQFAREVFLYHCIRHDVNIFRTQNIIISEKNHLAGFIRLCNEQITTAYITSKLKSITKSLLPAILPAVTTTSTTTTTTTEATATEANTSQVINNEMNDNDTTQVQESIPQPHQESIQPQQQQPQSLTIQFDSILPFHEAITKLYPSFPQIPLCTCGNFHANNTPTNDSTTTTQQCQLNCLNGYSSHSRQLLYSQMLYEALYSSAKP